MKTLATNASILKRIGRSRILGQFPPRPYKKCDSISHLWHSLYQAVNRRKTAFLHLNFQQHAWEHYLTLEMLKIAQKALEP